MTTTSKNISHRPWNQIIGDSYFIEATISPQQQQNISSCIDEYMSPNLQTCIMCLDGHHWFEVSSILLYSCTDAATYGCPRIILKVNTTLTWVDRVHAKGNVQGKNLSGCSYSETSSIKRVTEKKCQKKMFIQDIDVVAISREGKVPGYVNKILAKHFQHS